MTETMALIDELLALYDRFEPSPEQEETAAQLIEELVAESESSLADVVTVMEVVPTPGDDGIYDLKTPDEIGHMPRAVLDYIFPTFPVFPEPDATARSEVEGDKAA